ncbi:hypothetical protein N0V82_000163 [Gnomoniopsis sp. IMI 355080]|nr:hypothetical protein N0V82_000163 [Gnomoniopsis sp. IMI 355080]
MAKLDTPVHSDDDFDLLYDAESVSDVSDDRYTSGTASVRHDHVANPQRLTGPHEIPVMPYAATQKDMPEMTERAHGSTGPDETLSSSGIPRRSSGSTKGRGNMMSEGLQYTKSMYNKMWNKDALIAVMGMTGSGKTTFISKVTGRGDLQIGHDLTSCTRDIQVVETQINGQTVRFVDTPGFSDTNMSDTEVLQMIADYLAAAYKQEMKLSGIIYLHPISDNRVTHHTTKNLDMFRKLTGEKNLKNVILATSMWDKVTFDEGVRREEELKTKFWRLLTVMGAKTARHEDTAESAREIASMLLGNKPFYLQLQEEMGKDNKALRDTAAGKEVMIELVRMKEEHQRELAEMESLIKSSAKESESVIEALSENYQGRLTELEKTLRDERQMNEEAVRSLTDRIQALESRGMGCASFKATIFLVSISLSVILYTGLAHREFIADRLKTAKLPELGNWPGVFHKPTDRIPKQIWYKLGPKGKTDDVREWTQTCIEQNPGYRHEFVTDSWGDQYVEKTFSATRPDIVEVYTSLTVPIIKADLLRYLLLYAEGGVYSDLDVTCEGVPMDEWVPVEYQQNASLVVGWEFDWRFDENYIHQFASWTILSKPGVHHMMMVINDIVEAVHTARAVNNVAINELTSAMVGDIVDFTGPRRLTRSIIKSLEMTMHRPIARQEIENIRDPVLVDNVLILPGYAFSSVVEDFSNLEGGQPGPSLVRHHYAGSWKNEHGGELARRRPKRRDSQPIMH